jgi:hypothetical protein
VIPDSYWNGDGRFSIYGLESLSGRYCWPPQNPIPLAETIRLKLSKQNDWALADSLNDMTEKEKIAEFIIKDWGGIKGNSKSTLRRHAARAASDTHFPYAGIASYSKVLGVIDPLRFAILDARVVVSWNAIQLISGDQHGIFFSYLPGRNKVTGDNLGKRGFSQEKKFQRDSALFEGWIKPRRDDIYPVYLNYLRETAARFRRPLYELEMSLFADAERLAKQCADHFGVDLSKRR